MSSTRRPSTRFPTAWYKDPADLTCCGWSARAASRARSTCPTDGRYELWIEGSDTRRYRVAIDGREVAHPKMEMNSRGVSQPMSALNLTRGRHEITLVRGGGTSRPATAA